MNRRSFLVGLGASMGLVAAEPVRRIWAVGLNAPVPSRTPFYGIDRGSRLLAQRWHDDDLLEDFRNYPGLPTDPVEPCALASEALRGPIVGKRMDVVVCDDVMDDQPYVDGDIKFYRQSDMESFAAQFLRTSEDIGKRAAGALNRAVEAMVREAGPHLDRGTLDLGDPNWARGPLKRRFALGAT